MKYLVIVKHTVALGEPIFQGISQRTLFSPPGYFLSTQTVTLLFVHFVGWDIYAFSVTCNHLTVKGIRQIHN